MRVGQSCRIRNERARWRFLNYMAWADGLELSLCLGIFRPERKAFIFENSVE